MADESFSFEPLAGLDRESFSCGVEELDRYLLRQASQDASRKVAAPFVMLDESRRVAGYYTLSAYTVRISELPLDVAKRLPRYPLILATLLGRLAVSSEHRGKGLGAMLLADALSRCWRNTAEVASVGVVAEAMNDNAVAFYRHHEFEPLRDRPRRLFLAMKTIEKLVR